MFLSHIDVSLPFFLPPFPSLWNQLKKSKDHKLITENIIKYLSYSKYKKEKKLI